MGAEFGINFSLAIRHKPKGKKAKRPVYRDRAFLFTDERVGRPSREWGAGRLNWRFA